MSVIHRETLGGDSGASGRTSPTPTKRRAPARNVKSADSPSLLYLRSVPEDEQRSLGSQGSAAYLRSEERRRMQREAARVLRSGKDISFASDQTLPSVTKMPGRRTNLRLPVLSPSSFLLQNFDAAEWVLVQRRKRKSSFERRKIHRQCRFGSPPVRFRSSFLFKQPEAGAADFMLGQWVADRISN
jgi:hypothetical protein